jgi:uncharacterized protein (TIGR00299 family) protein
MKILYLECNMGAAGDMLMAALLELHNSPEDFLKRLNSIGIPNVEVTAERSAKCGITGTHVRVKINGDCKHNDCHHINHLIDSLQISGAAKKNALAVYKLLADAESCVHGVPVDKIHFHEIGELDAVADIVGVCMLMEELAPDLVLASPINVGSGSVRCAHGILPVPAPATAHILQNVPIYSDNINGELCTPTGAALLKYFAKEFCNMPTMSVSKIGYGMGKRDFEKVNCVRAYLGNAVGGSSEEVAELVCNLDDMAPETVAFAQELLLQEGALDVYVTPTVMKKGRPGFIFACLCHVAAKEKMLSLIFKHTSTLGIREYICRRHVLQREQSEIQTKFGAVKIKNSHGFGVKKSKPEYEDIARIARENNISFQDIKDVILR